MNRRRRSLLAAGLGVPLLVPLRSYTQAPRIEVMRFSVLAAGGPLPATLKRWAFSDQPRHTLYTLAESEGSVVLRAQADASTSGLAREIRVDLRTHPVLTWRWKPVNLVQRGNLARKEGDDFALRVYVTFDVDPDSLSIGERLGLSLARLRYGDALPRAALCYVWDAHAPLGAIVPNAYTDRVRMIVAESGIGRVGQWVTVVRNVRDDYLRAFGRGSQTGAPGAVPAVNGVIVSTDTDNTGESVEAYYGDIEFRS